eukprot:CAMPEP_0174990906 /NCGR_PEP_ID=MMETSP0004_2-20121128/21583_1 /TAXON_ID=420556 /ORGANISM="Ochromonas sp., Strain CCMP1393" /LENGTH=275 /DNA_ID=CAMNT_0016244569 /DNA_START=207 /DNA_END=1034 /DNA_ORIENTATION=-
MDSDAKYISDEERKELWKSISNYEMKAVQTLRSFPGDDKSTEAVEKKEEAYKLFAMAVSMRDRDPFFELSRQYAAAQDANDDAEIQRIMEAMQLAKLPPHLTSLVQADPQAASTAMLSSGSEFSADAPEEVDPGTTFSDTVTEKIRVKISSFYDADKSEPDEGKYMFWYKVAIHNESPEPVQVVARMWEIEKCKGEKEVVRGSGIQSQQPIIPPGDVFTYQSTCPLKVFPPKGKRILGSMSGAYTMCKGNMGQHNFTAKVSKFNLILPESVAASA